MAALTEGGPVRVVLASASPARRALLQSAGVNADVMVSGVDEDDVSAQLAPHALALLLAERKASAVAAKCTHQPGARRTVVIGCDSVLELDGVAYGKPRDGAEALAWWQGMRGRTGVLHTGHCLVTFDDPHQRRVVSAVGSAVIRFGQPSDAEIAAYISTGEPLLVAGGFTLDRLGGWFVEGIDGDPGNVLGLSLPLLRRLLAEVELSVTDVWSGPTRPSVR